MIHRGTPSPMSSQGDRLMRLTAGGLALACALGATLLGRPALAQTATPSDVQGRFKQVDRNGDGRIDRGEFHQVTVEAFYFLDKTRKGYLVLQDIPGITPATFRGADRNGDGKLSLQEFVNARFVDFQAADADHDGTLTYVEIEAYVRRTPR
jgi:Ca2+-binding EF-hand superfamily protein